MFIVGSLRRFTLAVDCYLRKIERIARAVQLENAQKHVVLVKNAIYFKAVENFKIENDDSNEIQLSNDTSNNTKTDYFYY